MFDLDQWQEIYASLTKNKWRTFLTALGVFWAIFMLILMLSSANGLNGGVREEFGALTTNRIAIWTRSTTMAHMGLPIGRYFNLRSGDVEALRKEVSTIDLVVPRNQLGGWNDGNNVTRGTKAGGFQVMGDCPEYQYIDQPKMLAGRFINQLDMEGQRKTCVIGTRVRTVLFEPGEDPIGEYITINTIPFQVVGVFGPKQDGDRALRATQTIYIPFTTFQRAFNYGDRIGWLSLMAKPGLSASAVEQEAVSVLARLHKIHPQDRRAFGRWNAEKEFEQIQGVFTVFDLVILFVGIGTLLAGVIGVSNIMLIIVKERTREFGIRRAMGATPWSVIRQVITESIVLTSIAGYLGLVAAVALNAFYNSGLWIDFLNQFGLLLDFSVDDVGMFQRPGIELEVALRALGILIFFGALAGILPAYRAVQVSPVDALRAE
ncbi:MAG: ABC transporter permease [Bacteroidota bacterium]